MHNEFLVADGEVGDGEVHSDWVQLISHAVAQDNSHELSAHFPLHIHLIVIIIINLLSFIFHLILPFHSPTFIYFGILLIFHGNLNKDIAKLL